MSNNHMEAARFATLPFLQIISILIKGQQIMDPMKMSKFSIIFWSLKSGNKLSNFVLDIMIWVNSNWTIVQAKSIPLVYIYIISQFPAFSRAVFGGSVLLIFFSFVLCFPCSLCLSLSCVSCAQCCQCLWIVLSCLFLRLSLAFIPNAVVMLI